MSYQLLLLVLLIAITDWWADYNDLRTLEYLVKPGTIAALLAWLWQVSRFKRLLRWFALGLVLSLVGDVLLILPGDWFVPGLVAFLLAHVAYIVGFNLKRPPQNFTSLLLFLGVASVTWLVHERISAGLIARGETDLLMPVFVYSVVIGLMLLSALSTLLRPEWATRAALLVSGGAALFFFSDTLLAWNKFVAPIQNGSTYVIVTYHLGQIALALGATLHSRE